MSIVNQMKLKVRKAKLKELWNTDPIEAIPEKYKIIIILILVNTILWMVVTSQYQQVMSPNTIYISRAEASTGGEIELLGTPGVVKSVDSPASQPVSEAIKATAEVKAKASNLGDDGIIAKIQAAFPGDEDMVKIAYAESRFKPDAEHLNNNGTRDCGLFQVNSTWGYDCNWLKNPENNIKVAKIIYATKLGKGNWATYNWAIQHNEPI